MAEPHIEKAFEHWANATLEILDILEDAETDCRLSYERMDPDDEDYDDDEKEALETRAEELMELGSDLAEMRDRLGENLHIPGFVPEPGAGK